MQKICVTLTKAHYVQHEQEISLPIRFIPMCMHHSNILAVLSSLTFTSTPKACRFNIYRRATSRLQLTRKNYILFLWSNITFLSLILVLLPDHVLHFNRPTRRLQFTMKTKRWFCGLILYF